MRTSPHPPHPETDDAGLTDAEFDEMVAHLDVASFYEPRATAKPKGKSRFPPKQKPKPPSAAEQRAIAEAWEHAREDWDCDPAAVLEMLRKDPEVGPKVFKLKYRITMHWITSKFLWQQPFERLLGAEAAFLYGRILSYFHTPRARPTDAEPPVPYAYISSKTLRALRGLHRTRFSEIRKFLTSPVKLTETSYGSPPLRIQELGKGDTKRIRWYARYRGTVAVYLAVLELGKQEKDRVWKRFGLPTPHR
jgi:hypothetical protein